MDKKNFEKAFNYIKLFSIFSIFTGILYQYFSIKHNMAFFSYSEVLNDSIYIVPYVLVFVGSIYISNLYIHNYKKWNYKIGEIEITDEKHVKLDLVLINTLIAAIILIGFHYKIITINKVTDICGVFFVLIALYNIFSHLYVESYSIKSIKIAYIIIGTILYLMAVGTFSKIQYQNLCFAYQDKVMHVSYMNDKYIFLDSGHVIVNHNINEFIYIKECKEENIKNNQ